MTAPAPALQFLGAARTVTGSRFLVDTPRARVLVDCGLFQGAKELRLRNWAPFPVDPRSIDAIVVTHAHVDHCGYLPALVARGFAGSIFCTSRTAELCHVVLPDAGRLQEEDAAHANRRGFSKHHPALPLFTEADAIRALARLRPSASGQPIELAPGVRVSLHRAGHILGSAWLRLVVDDREGDALLVSGDLGRPRHPILEPPEAPAACGTLLVESTYGGRRHDDAGAVEKLAAAVARTADRGGAVVIPAFAVDRTEVLLLHLRDLVHAGRIPPLPVYVDSPMALDGLAVYERAIAAGDAEIRADLRHRPAPFDPGKLIPARDTAASKAIHDAPMPAIIVSASGMATGGRVLHHLARRLPDPRNTVVLVGYQPAGTRGRSLLEGAATLRIHGHDVPVRAEIVDGQGFSVHADGAELVDWLAAVPSPPRIVYAVHGELDGAVAIQRDVAQRLGWMVAIPQLGERVPLG